MGVYCKSCEAIHLTHFKARSQGRQIIAERHKYEQKSYANEKAVMDQYGWHNVAWVLYPSFAVLIDDIYNPIFLSVFGNLFAG